MRSSKSRSRNKQNRPGRPAGGNIINRVFESSGPDGKVRGTPQQIIEKYNQLYRDAQLANDRVNAENFAQHAEHYTRLLAEALREIERAREEQEQWNRDRQAERDRERAQRLRVQEEMSGGAAPFAAAPDAQPDLMVDVPEAVGLVETPESRPEPGGDQPPPREGRGPRPERRPERRPGFRRDRDDRGDRGVAPEGAAAEAPAGPAAATAAPQPQPAPEASAQPEAGPKPRAATRRRPRARPAAETPEAPAKGPAEAAE
jgi:hypothetical protein